MLRKTFVKLKDFFSSTKTSNLKSSGQLVQFFVVWISLSSLHWFDKKIFLLLANPVWFCPQFIGCFDPESISSFREGWSGFELKCKNQRLQMFCLWFFHLYSNPYQSSVFVIPFPSKISNQNLLGNWDNYFFMVWIL